MLCQSAAPVMMSMKRGWDNKEPTIVKIMNNIIHTLTMSTLQKSDNGSSVFFYDYIRQSVGHDKSLIVYFYCLFFMCIRQIQSSKALIIINTPIIFNIVAIIPRMFNHAGTLFINSHPMRIRTAV